MATNNEAPQPEQANNFVIACPAGLEPLINVEYLFVKQAVVIGENFFNARNFYDIMTNTGERVYHVAESTDPMTRAIDNNDMPYSLFVLDSTARPVLRMAGLPPFCCAPGELDLYYFGFKFGSIKQTSGYIFGCGTPKFDVLNSENQVVLRIVSRQSKCCIGCCGKAEFKVLSVDGSMEIGKISKMWGGLLQEMFTSADNFGVSMPPDLDIQIKALLMCTAIMIDFHYFNQSQVETQGHHHYHHHHYQGC